MFVPTRKSTQKTRIFAFISAGLLISFAVSGCASVSHISGVMWETTSPSPEAYTEPAPTYAAHAYTLVYSAPATPSGQFERPEPTPIIYSDAKSQLTLRPLLAQLRPGSAPDADIVRAQSRTRAATRTRTRQSDLELAGG
jgi:hypothetical protein